ncbi:MAG TPA: YebC/PmpR family DNA-binding transcriptional regulator [Caldisericia bacterium]|nr:YebC/PmpR family DNA-binding transcriptional regulator [Caldisericia bacterium]
MSGHSKWHNIKGKKQAEDAKRGKIFTKVGKEVTIAARVGGGSPDSNPRLRTAIEKAKAAGMPNDNIKRALMRGTGELQDGTVIEELTYEGYGPNGVAILVDVTSDNKNRTSAEIRKVFSKFGGNMGEQGCVAWMFNPVGKIVLKNSMTEDEAYDIAGLVEAQDVQQEGEQFALIVGPTDLYKAKDILDEKKIETESVDQVKVPTTTVKLTGDEAIRMLKLISDLEDHDDVDEVFANFDISDEEIEAFYNSN